MPAYEAALIIRATLGQVYIVLSLISLTADPGSVVDLLMKRLVVLVRPVSK